MPPRLSCAALVLGALAGCGPEHAATPAADLTFSVRRGTLTGPDSVGAGWTRLRIEEDNAGHGVVLFRLPAAASGNAVKAFLAAMDSAAVTPAPALALGGPEVGKVGDVVLQLTPGLYVLGCVRRATNGHRHASAGEAKVLVVTNSLVSGRETPPAATQEVQMVDFAYVGPERWSAGSHMLRVENHGTQDHQLILARLREGVSLSDWMNADDSSELAASVAGAARMGPGAIAYVPMQLAAGEYVAYCLIADPASGREHVAMGMFRAIKVE